MPHAYFYVDRRDQLRRVRAAAVRRLLAGRVHVRAAEVRLAAVALDADLTPTAVHLVRSPLTGGRFTAADARTLAALATPACVTPAEAAAYHRAGWPRDLGRQLAVALDVPRAALRCPVRGGGPVLDAALAWLALRRPWSER